MQIKYLINKLERILNEKYLHIDINFYCSRRKKIVHFGIERSIQQYKDYVKFIKDIKFFFFKKYEK